MNQKNDTQLEDFLRLCSILTCQSFVQLDIKWAIHGIQVHARHFLRRQLRVWVGLGKQLGSEQSAFHIRHSRSCDGFVDVNLWGALEPIDRIEVRQVRLKIPDEVVGKRHATSVSVYSPQQIVWLSPPPPLAPSVAPSTRIQRFTIDTPTLWDLSSRTRLDYSGLLAELAGLCKIAALQGSRK